MVEIMPCLREALAHYDPQWKTVKSVTRVNRGVFRVDYLDVFGVRWTFTYRENDDDGI